MNGSVFAGFCELGDTLTFAVLAQTSAGAPANSSTTPGYRIYGNGALMANGTGSLSFMNTGTVTGATNVNPIVITSSGHGLSTGIRVTVENVGGNTAANTTATITSLTSDTFQLDSVAGNGAYTSGGTWKVTGLYKTEITPEAANGFAAGEFYDVFVTMTISGDVVTQGFRIGVN